MAEENITQIFGLSLNANPHPPGVYHSALRLAAHKAVRARGEDYARVTAPRKYRLADTLYSGRVVVWTDIDLRGPWINLENDEELGAQDKALIVIPEKAKPNFRSFEYLLDETKHIMWIEARNELRQNLGPSTARKIVANLLSSDILGEDHPQIDVNIVPQDGAVDQILALPRLQSLTIRVNIPNADSSSPDARRRVFTRLENSNAKTIEVVLRKTKTAAKLTPEPDVRELAMVAADTGYVRGEEKGADGKKYTLSTTELPKRVNVENSRGGSFIARVASKLHLI